MFAVVPLIGAGTDADPIRPAYAPAPRPRGSTASPPRATGIVGFNWVMSDDQKHAIVEFVARDRSAFQPLLADRSPDVKVFERGMVPRVAIETVFKTYKKNINLDGLMVRVP